MHEAILNDVARYVEAFYKSHFAAALKYHNISHTRLVSLYALEMSHYYKLDNPTILTIQAAAWFHDTGHLIGPMEGHEHNSIKIMRNYFSEKDVPEQLVSTIADLIMATKIPVSPASLPEEILCDADTFHVGTSSFFDLDSLVWQETELRQNTTITDQLERTLHFLQSHKFYTSYCKEQLDGEKQKNINCIKALLKEGHTT